MSTAVLHITPDVEVFTLWRAQATILYGISCVYGNFARFLKKLIYFSCMHFLVSIDELVVCCWSCRQEISLKGE